MTESREEIERRYAAVREAFNLWTPLYLTRVVGVGPGFAGFWSFVFPGAGAVTAVVAGWAVDRRTGA